MNEHQEGRRLDEANAGKLNRGKGTLGKSRSMAQMVSVRLDAALVAELKHVARSRNLSLSELLREGALEIVQQEAIRRAPKVETRLFGKWGAPSLNTRSTGATAYS